MSKIKFRQRGFISLKTLFILLLSGLVFYSAATTVGFYYKYFAAQSAARDYLMNVNYNPDEQLNQNYFKQLKKLGIPIKKNNYSYVRDGNEVYIAVKYFEKLQIFDHLLHEFKFEFKESRKLRPEEESPSDEYSDEYSEENSDEYQN